MRLLVVCSSPPTRVFSRPLCCKMAQYPPGPGLPRQLPSTNRETFFIISHLQLKLSPGASRSPAPSRLLIAAGCFVVAKGDAATKGTGASHRGEKAGNQSARRKRASLWLSLLVGLVGWGETAVLPSHTHRQRIRPPIRNPQSQIRNCKMSCQIHDKNHLDTPAPPPVSCPQVVRRQTPVTPTR